MADEGSILPHQQISLGLDLRGGVYLLVGVDLSALMEQDRDNLQEGIRAALNEAGLLNSEIGIAGDAVEVTLPSEDEAERARAVINGLQQSLAITSPADNTLRVVFTEAAPRERTHAPMSQSVEVLRRQLGRATCREQRGQS